MSITIAQLCERIKAGYGRARDSHGKNERDNMIYRAFWSTERYVVDFADEFTAEGWMQFDTDQDASYFGVWVNPSKLLTMTYAEGDWTLVECRDAAHYNAEVRDAIRFYGEGFVYKAYDLEGGCEIGRQDRSVFLLPEPANA